MGALVVAFLPSYVDYQPCIYCCLPQSDVYSLVPPFALSFPQVILKIYFAIILVGFSEEEEINACGQWVVFNWKFYVYGFVLFQIEYG